MFKQSLKYLAISTIILSRTFPTIASCNDEAEPGISNKLKPEFTIIAEIKKPPYSYSNNYDARISADGSTIAGNIDEQNFYWTKEKGYESFSFTNQPSNTKTKGSNILSVNFDGTVF